MVDLSLNARSLQSNFRAVRELRLVYRRSCGEQLLKRRAGIFRAYDRGTLSCIRHRGWNVAAFMVGQILEYAQTLYP